MAMNKLVNGPTEDRELLPQVPRMDTTPVPPRPLPAARPVECPGWPFDVAQARAKQLALSEQEMEVDLGSELKLKLVKIPAGEFVMGAADGEPDEYPLARVPVLQPFWMGAVEVSNEQFRQFDPGFDCGYLAKRHARDDDKGLPLDSVRQPAVRVSWERAMDFCRWLSARSGLRFSLPTEAQWEWACRAGSAGPFHFAGADADFSPWANLADQSYGKGHRENGEQITGGLEHLVMDGAALSNRKFNDRAIVTAAVGRYQPNAWGLHDMHGNAAEWTLSTYQPYPYRDDDGRNTTAAAGEKTVRGGSFSDRPARGRASFRLAYPSWQRLANVGFRVVCETEPPRCAELPKLPANHAN
jgi:formylglycine-generating enzyme required for sulfatase activity